MNIIQLLFQKNKKQYSFYNLVCLPIPASLAIYLFLYVFYWPQQYYLEQLHHSIEQKQHAVVKAKELQSKVLRPTWSSAPMYEYYVWLGSLANSTGVKLNEIKEHHLNDNNLPVRKLKLTYYATGVAWLGFIRHMLDVSTVLLADFHFTENKLSTMELIVFLDKPRPSVRTKQFKHLSTVFCQSRY